MAVTASMVKALRESTGAGMMDCKNALAEAAETHSDEQAIMEAAVDILRKRGMAKAAKRLDRETSEGRVVFRQEGGHLIMLSVTCETDFVSRNDDFGALANKLIDHAWATNADSLDAFLSSQIGDQSVTDFLAEQTGSIGEKIEVKHYHNINSNGVVVPYIHSNMKVGSLIDFNVDSTTDEVTEFGKDVAMHIAAMKPVALDRNSVDPSLIDKELEIIKEQLRNEGKPEDMLEKISQGKLNRFFKDNTLVDQPFVKAEKGESVAASAKKVDGSISFNQFIRVAIGE